ncbi:MAG: tetratricopeptide repeat protein [Candidatus Zixiibacteriota bacterium]|nr:MAG: tetratricopeptide repeat protein [candidate division Zixibacteria bacterium]
MRRGWLNAAVILMFIAFALSGCANKWVTSGKIAMNGKNYDKAISDFKKALEENPDNGEAHYYLAVCYEEREDYEEMLRHLELAETLYPKKAGDMKDLRQEGWTKLFESGRGKAEEEKWEESREDFLLGSRILPSRYEAFSNLGFVWQHLDNNDSAFFYYSRAYEIAPDEMLVLENFANLCYNAGRYDRAHDLYKEILEKDPGHAGAMARLGDIYGEKKEFQTAIGYYNQALDIEQDNCNLWFRLGVLYFQEIKDNDSAINAFGRAVELCPEDKDAFINLSIALIMGGRFDEAVEKLSGYVVDNPDDCTGWDLYSQALLRKGMKEEALEADKKYKECTGK